MNEMTTRGRWAGWRAAGIVALVVGLFAAVSPARAQFGAEGTPAATSLVKASAAAVTVAAGSRVEAVVTLTIAQGWHVNANPPALDYNIPTEVGLTGASGLSAGAVRYPAGRAEKFGFEETPLLVYDGTVEVRVPIVASAAATSAKLAGTVEFQACNDQVCLAPASVPFELDVTVTPAAVGSGAPDASGTPPADSAVAPAAGDESSFSTAPPTGAAGSAVARSRLEQTLAQGGLGWFLALFVGGLLLNLTPCVFPMLGITVSIFGARRQEPLPKVFATAVLYVLGICVTYTALGVVAALTGGLFGSALQSVWVSVVLGGIMLLLSLSMFGLYEMQPPTWVLARLGGAQATNFAGAFVSGLGVGVIAAPCVGPFVVAVLALIAQKGQLGFGMQTMFTLSLGLGFPYLFLATFSNLLQSLPRSGDWMDWVKHVFGTVMAAIGLYYLFIGFAPDLAPWVLPGALVVGGAWLGFLDRSAGEAGRFKSSTQVAGLVVIVAGVVMGSQMYQAATRTLKFQPYEATAVEASLAAGRPVMMDFSADWCVPCHEMELGTFTDPRVVAAARGFDRYKVDLTKYDSPESEASRKRYGITGVPTVVFLGADGREIATARVEGFLPPEPFLERMRLGGTR